MKLWKHVASLAQVISLMIAILAIPAYADFPEVLAESKKGVVQLYVLGKKESEAVGVVGTGFAIGRKGEDSDTFLTNWHVITASGEFSLSEVRIWILKENCEISNETGEPEADRSVECEVLKTTTGYPDYAIIRAKTPIKGYKALPLLRSNDAPDGTRIYALGYPAIVGDVSANQYGIDDITATDGIISQHMQYVPAENTWVLMHTAQISGGNSGGPLITEEGAVVGINTYGFGESNGTVNRYCSVFIDYAMDGLDELQIHYDLYSEEEEEEGGIVDKLQDLFRSDEKTSEEEKNYTVFIVMGAAATVAAISGILIYQSRKKASEIFRRQEQKQQEERQHQQEEPQWQQQVQQDKIRRQMEAQTGERIHLRCYDGRVIPITNGATIGRDKGNTIVLPADTPGISRNHCRLDVQNGRVILTDLNSTYGILIHGKRIPPNTPVALNVGSSFSLASEQYTFTVC